MSNFNQFPSMGTYTIGCQEDLILYFSKTLTIQFHITFSYGDYVKSIPIFYIEYAELQRLVAEAGVKVRLHGMFNFHIREEDDYSYVYYGDYPLFAYKYYKDSCSRVYMYNIHDTDKEIFAATILVETDNYGEHPTIKFTKLEHDNEHIPDSVRYPI